MTLFGKLFGWKKGSPEDEPASVEVLDEDRISESLTQPTTTTRGRPRKVALMNRSHAIIPPLRERTDPVATLPSPRQAEERQHREARERHMPAALHDLARPDSGSNLLLQALAESYMESLLAQRLDAWATTGHSIVDLLAGTHIKVHSRSSVADYVSDRVFDGARPISPDRVDALKRAYMRQTH